MTRRYNYARIIDNIGLYEEYEIEQARIKRQRKRLIDEWDEVERELPFVAVPDDYGTHKELY